MCKLTGFRHDEVIDIKDWADASKLCYAQTIVEQGKFAPYFTTQQLEDGARRAGVHNVPVRPLLKTMSGVGAAVAGAGTLAANNLDAVVSGVNTIKPIIDGANSAALHHVFIAAVVIGFGLVGIGLLRKHQRDKV